MAQQLDDASSFLTTFNTELGRFWYTVMPFGATVAGDIFQRKLDECLGKLKQVIIIADDIMVAGYKPYHNFFGETYTTSGHEPARSKVSAITAMPFLANKKQV